MTFLGLNKKVSEAVNLKLSDWKKTKAKMMMMIKKNIERPKRSHASS